MIRFLLTLMVAFSTALYPAIASANSNYIFRYKAGNIGSINYQPPSSEDFDITAVFTGFIGEPLEYSVPIKPGSSVARWRMGEGSLPTSLSFSEADGKVTGTPSKFQETHFFAHGIDPNGFESTTASVTAHILTPRDYANRVDLYAHVDRHFSLPITKGGQVVDHWIPEVPLPSWASAASGWLQGTPPTGSEGVYGLALSGRNHLGEEIAFVQGVLTVEAGPTIAFIGDTTLHPSDDFDVRAVVMRSMGELSFALEGDLPSNLRFNRQDGEIYGRISTFSTSTTLRISARDIDGTVGYSNWFTLSTLDPVVDISNINDLSLVLGEPTYYRFNAADLSGTKSWLVSAGTLPAGITLDEETGVLSGTPEQIERQENIVLSVSTSDGGADTSNPFAIEVFPAPIVAETTPVRTRINTPFTSLPPVVSGATLPTFALADGFSLPAGMNFNVSSGQTDGQVALAGNHSISFVVNDSDGRVSSPFIQGVEAFNPLSISYSPTYALPRMSEITPILPTIPADSIMPSGTNTFGNFTITPSLPEGLSFGARSGAISGTPVNEGTYGPFTVTLTDGSGEAATSSPFALEVTPRLDLAVTVDKTTVRAWMPISDYIVSAQHFVGDVTWVLESGTIPDGLMFRDDGRVTGRATAVGTAPGIVLRATDSEGSTATTEPFTLSVIPPDPIEFSETFEWSVSRSFAKQLTALNSAGETTFTVSPTTPLPSGVSLSSDGVLSGSIGTVSSTTHSVTVEDSQGRTDTGTLAIIIRPQMTMTLASEHTVARASEASIVPTVSNGIGDVSFTRSGTLPDGLSLNGVTGEIAGIPTSTGVWSGIRITASDDAGNSADQTIRITVAERNALTLSYDFSNPLTVNSSSGLPALPQSPTNAIGETSFTYTGTLPQGLTLNATSGAFTGVPTETGVFPGISVTIEDGEGQTDTFGPFSISVTTGGPLKVSDQDRWARKGAYINTGPITAMNAIEPLAFSATNNPPAGLTVISTDGSLQGTDAPLGDHVVRMQVVDGIGRIDTFNIVVHIVGDLDISYPNTPFNLHSSRVLSPNVENVIGAPTFVLSGALPDGLSFNQSNGEISGTPTQLGTFGGLTVSVTDEGVTGNTATSAPFSITVNPRHPLQISYPASNPVIAAQGYSLSPQIENAVGSLNWSYTGVLPIGMTFDAVTGQFGGVADEVGSFPNINVTATDTADGATATATLSFNVASDGLPIRLDTYDVQTKAGYPFVAGLPKVSNAIGDYYFLSPDSSTHGLTFDPATGTVSGTVNETTRITVNVEVTDTTNRLTSKPVVIDVIPNIRLTVVSHIHLNVSSEMATVAPLTDYAIGSVEYELFGTLPQGLSFNTTSGRIGGTPTQMGTFEGFSIRATDSIGDATISDEFSITVHSDGEVPRFTQVTPVFSLTVGGAPMSYTPNWYTKKTGDILSLNMPLPDGITLDPATGNISGTPSAGSEGVYEGYHFTVTDTSGLSGHSNDFTINVIPADRGTFSGGVITARHNQPFESSIPTYDPSTVIGSLSFRKAGSTWNSWYVDTDIDPETGIIYGSTSAGSSLNFGVIPTDSVGDHDPYTVNVNLVPFEIDYNFTQDVDYGTEISVLPDLTNAVGSTSFSINSGVLPSGVSLDSNTGLISGVPETRGWTDYFSISVTDDYGTATTNNLRFKIVDTVPDAFAWTDIIDVEPGTYAVSDLISITGFSESASFTLTSDAPAGSAVILRCNTSGTSCVFPSTISPGPYLHRLRVRSGSYGETITTTLDINGVSTTWKVTTRELDTTPDPFSFADVPNQMPTTWVESEPVRISGNLDPSTVTASGGDGAIFARVSHSLPMTSTYRNLDAYDITVPDGFYLQIRAQTPPDFGETRTLDVNVGGYTTQWVLSTIPPSTTPDDLVLGEITGASPNGLDVRSSFARVTGITEDIQVTVSSPSNDAYMRICPTLNSYSGCSSNVTNTLVSNGDYIVVFMPTALDNSITKTATVSLGGKSFDWSVTTRDLITVPNSFDFTDLIGVYRNQERISDYVRISGIPDPLTATISGPADAKFRRCPGNSPSHCTPWHSIGDELLVGNGGYINLSMTSSNDDDTAKTVSFNIGTVSEDWTVKTMPFDDIPDDIVLDHRMDVNPGATVSAVIRVTGISEDIPVSISGPSGSLYYICSSTSYCGSVGFTSGTVKPNGYLKFEMPAGAYDETVSMNVNIGPISRTFSATTRSIDTSPNPFSFAPRSGLDQNREYDTRTSSTLTGSLDPLTVSISGNGAAWCKSAIVYGCRLHEPGWTTSDGTIRSNEILFIRATSAPTYATSTDVVVNVGDFTTTWTLTTMDEP